MIFFFFFFLVAYLVRGIKGFLLIHNKHLYFFHPKNLGIAQIVPRQVIRQVKRETEGEVGQGVNFVNMQI